MHKITERRMNLIYEDFTAQDMHNLADLTNGNVSKANGLLNKISKQIQEKAHKGQYFLFYYREMPPELTEYLISLGYKITNCSTRDDKYKYYITW